jgi:hypothetical protein
MQDDKSHKLGSDWVNDGSTAFFAAAVPQLDGLLQAGLTHDKTSKETLRAASGTVTNGGTDLFTLYDPKDAGKVLDYAFTGAGTDQVSSSLTGSITVGADGIAYIAVAIENIGQDYPNQKVTLNVGGLSSTITVVDAPSNQATFALGSNIETITMKSPNNLILGTLGSVNQYGTESGGTLLVGDYIDGGAGNSTTLSLLQNSVNTSFGFDVLPVGITIKNVQLVTVASVQALGGVIDGTTEYFDTTGIDQLNGASTLGSLYVQTSLGQDYLKVGTATNVTIDNDGPLIPTYDAGVTLVGGDNVTVTETGGASAPSSATISGAAGTVSVTDDNASPGGFIDISGGTNIAVNGFGTVNIGGESGSVSVNDYGYGDAIDVTGGTSDSITGTGAITVADALGTISVADSGYGNAINVSYGTNQQLTGQGEINSYLASGTVNILDTGDGESASVFDSTSHGGTVAGAGDIIFSAQSSAPTLLVTQGSSAYGDTNSYSVETQGGQAVTIDNTGGFIDFEGQFIANTNSIQEGLAPEIVTNPNGTQYDATSGSEAGASVVIEDAYASGLYGTGAVTAYTNGATVASITGGSDLLLEDINTVALVRSAGAAATPGTSKLARVTLDGVGGTAQVITDALATLTLDHSGLNGKGATDVTVTDRSSAALALNVSNDAAGTALTDNTATSIAIGATGNYDQLTLAASAAKSLSVSGSQVLVLTSGAGLGNLASITISGAAGLYDEGTAHGLQTYASLVTINGSATSGNINVAIGPAQSFTGGSGVDTVTISADQLSAVHGGSGTANVLVANALGSVFTTGETGKNVSGFHILETTGASGGTYDLKNVFGGISDVVVAAGPSAALTFSNAGATETLAIDGNLVSSREVTILQASGVTGPTSLNLALGTHASAGVNDQTLTAQNYASVAIASLGLVNSETGASVGTNTLTLADAAASSLTLTGAESLVVSSSGNAIGSINATGAAASAVLDLLGLGLTSGGVTVTDGGASVLFTGNVTSLKTDTVTFASGNSGANVITETGTGALLVNGADANGNNIVTAKYGVLDATLGNGNNAISGGNATTSITAGNGDNDVNVGSAIGSLGVSVVLGNGSDVVNILSHGADTVRVGGGVGVFDAITVGNGNAGISVGTATTTGSLAGSAVITIGSGNDVIGAGAGTYTVNLGSGNDTLTANVGASGAGGATVNFGATPSYGADKITLGDGKNTINGAFAEGSNSVSLGNGANAVVLGNGNNTVTLGNGNDLVSLGSGNNAVSVGSGISTLTVGGGANQLTLHGGADTIDLTAPGSSGLFTTITGAAPGDTIAFIATNGAVQWEGGGATGAGSEVSLPPNATFADYLNAASFANGATNSQLAWFDYGGNQYVVEDNSSAGTFVSGLDYVVKFAGASLNLADTSLDSLHNGVVLHS